VQTSVNFGLVLITLLPVVRDVN